jgi:hypothetical protein
MNEDCGNGSHMKHEDHEEGSGDTEIGNFRSQVGAGCNTLLLPAPGLAAEYEQPSSGGSSLLL